MVADVIHGDVAFDNALLDDWILVRTDGTPTYNFCNVVDDVSMKITHVIRGNDHLSNTPKQVQCYEAFGYPAPRFAHIPMILGADKSRLSKRHGATSVQAYRDAGILPEAMVNYLARLGWSHGDQEIFSAEDLIRRVRPGPYRQGGRGLRPGQARVAVPSLDQGRAPLASCRATSSRSSRARGCPCPADRGLARARGEHARGARAHARGHGPARRSSTCARPPRTSARRRRSSGSRARPSATRSSSGGSRPTRTWRRPRSSCSTEVSPPSSGCKLVDVAQLTRIALTGRAASPPIFEVISILGKAETLARLRAAADACAAAAR